MLWRWILLTFLVVTPLSVFSQIDYQQLDLEKKVATICDLVDRLQPGSYHYFDCLHYGEKIIEKQADLTHRCYQQGFDLLEKSL